MSNLFRQLRRYAETHADKWYVLSAKYGLVGPHQMVSPYQLTLLTMPQEQRRTWARGVGDKLLREMPADADLLLLPGQRYREHLEPILLANGFRVEIPLRGLAIGKQLQWLKNANESAARSRS